MVSRKGFTLIELMVVIMIVAILAAVAIPIMRGRIDSAKWSEGKAIMGTIGTALRAYAAEKAETGTYAAGSGSVAADVERLGFSTGDFSGTYFSDSSFTWTSTYTTSGAPPLTFTITGTAPASIKSPTTVTLDHTGKWTP